MDLLDLIDECENQDGLFRRVESFAGLHGFRDRDNVVWVVKDSVDLSVTVDGVTVTDLWKCFAGLDLEGVFRFVVLRLLNGSPVVESFVLADVVGVVFF